MMKTIYDKFMTYLIDENKEGATQYIYQLLNEKSISIESLYLDILAPSLNSFECVEKDEEICIWKEHIRSSIIRTILDISYLFILEQRKTKKKINKKVVLLTPAFELHEIGAIMIAHLMLLEGFDASFVGANTPKGDILSAIRAYQPDYIALSVTNPYNLVITKQVTDEIRKFFPELKIILGGQAFSDQNALPQLSYDYIIQSLDDLKKFADEVRA